MFVTNNATRNIGVYGNSDNQFASKIKRLNNALLKNSLVDKMNNSYNLINSSNDIKVYSANKSNNKEENNLLNAILDNKSNLMYENKLYIT